MGEQGNRLVLMLNGHSRRQIDRPPSQVAASTSRPICLTSGAVPSLALQTPTDKEWFQGTADAVRQYAWLLTDTKNRGIEDVVILSGDHL
jgi:hypothetical protein